MTGKLRRQPTCISCSQRPVAMQSVKFCFDCWPGGPVVAPPCLRCGSTRDYFTSGICARCHVAGRPGVDACRDCHAWGVTRMYDWRCRGCHSWRRNHPTVAACSSCRRVLPLGEQDACRLCHKQAGLLRDGQQLELVEANRHGQQLFLADLFSSHTTSAATHPAAVAHDNGRPERAWSQPAEQLVLFTGRRDLAAHGRAGLHLRADPGRAAALERSARNLAAQRGWNTRQSTDTCLGIRIVLGLQDSAGQPINASDVALLSDIDLPVWTVLEVLAENALLVEDRTPAVDSWFARETAGLPEPMASELRGWFEVMKNGSTRAPRSRPRAQRTLELHLHWALPTLRAWAADGHTSLREITRKQVLDALPASGNPRSTAGQGLKSVFRLLKARKVLFTDPTARVKTGQHEARQPLPVDLDLVRAGLRSTDPARAALVGLLAFNGLRSGHLQRLQLTDVCDGKLHVDGRSIPLAEPVRDRLRSYLDHRAARWPHTTNPHLFVHYRTAGTTAPVGHRWVLLHVGPGLTPASIREDRILNEAHTTGGDIRRLSDLFGLSINASTRYAATLDHPDLTAPGLRARPAGSPTPSRR